METLTEKIAKYLSIIILIVAIVFIALLKEPAIGYVIMFSGVLLAYLVGPSIVRGLVGAYAVSALVCASLYLL